jgi:hypothetical protein
MPSSIGGTRLVDHFDGFARMLKGGRRLQTAQAEHAALRDLSLAQVVLVWAWHENEAADRLFRLLDVAPHQVRSVVLECAVQAVTGAARSLAAAINLPARPSYKNARERRAMLDSLGAEFSDRNADTPTSREIRSDLRHAQRDCPSA